MEHPIRVTLGLIKRKFEAIFAGKEEFNTFHGDWHFKRNCRWEGSDETVFVDVHDSVVTSYQADLFMQFLGKYVADGFLVGDAAIIAVSAGDDTPSLLDSLGLTYSVANDVRDPYRKDRGTTDYIKIASPDLATYLKCMGAVVPTKLPDAVHRLSPKLLLKFLESYQEADGRKSDTSYCVADSASLAFDLELICLKLGWAIDITRQTKNTVQMRIVRRGLQPLVKTDGEAPTIGTHGMVPYEGLVFCVTVPNHLVYVRRNKTTYWCGNSGRLVRLP